jgi:hypothetical protein
MQLVPLRYGIPGILADGQNVQDTLKIGGAVCKLNSVYP